MTVELIRHGETALQAQRRYQGRTDAPLSPAGRDKLRRADHDPDRVYVTALCRTGQTAAVLFPNARQIVIPALGEMDFGDFEGRSYEEMEHDSAYRGWVAGMCLGKCPGGESRAEFSRRVCSAFTELLDGAFLSSEKHLVIVAHGGTQMAVLERFATEKRDYYAWQLPSGHGYLLDAADFISSRRLQVLGQTDHTRG